MVDAADTTPLRIAVPDTGDAPVGDVSALLTLPPRARACFICAHGAGAGMQHPFMVNLAAALATKGIATLRFQFPYMERGSKRVDTPAVAQATVRAAVDAAKAAVPHLPLLAGGKSYGGRMASQAQAEAPLPGVAGLVFVGYPLHPEGQPGIARARHLSAVPCPMLFLQGTRDALADATLMRGVVDSLNPRATAHFFDDADHSFHVRKASGTNDAAVITALAAAIGGWFDALPR